MAKVVVSVPYGDFVVDAKDALLLADVLSKSERYQSKYHSAEGDKPSHNTHHIYEMDPDSTFQMRIVTDDNYKLFKLAGKPED